MATRWLPDDGDAMRMGISTDTLTGEDTIVQQQDVAPILKQNQIAANENLSYRKKDSLFYPIGRIPNGVAFRWLVEDGIDCNNPDHLDQVIQMLHRPEWSKLRTSTGKYTKRPDRQHFSAAPDGGIAGATAKIGKQGTALRSGRVGSI